MACCTKFPDTQPRRALGKTFPGTVANERAMEPSGRCLPERFVEKNLAGGGSEEIGSANHLGDTGIIDDNRKLVSGDIVTVPDEEVSEIPQSGLFNNTETTVMK